LASNPVLSGYIYILFSHHNKYGNSTSRQLAVQEGNFPIVGDNPGFFLPVFAVHWFPDVIFANDH
jgi:hypothetical protein